MRTFAAFLKKEWMETVRTGRLTILLIIFGLFGIMNPAISKLTPWMMKLMSQSLQESGVVVSGTATADAMISWMQFYKNIPMALLALVLLLSSSFTSEYQKGTLIPILTKGLSRWKVVAAKTVHMLSLWTVCYWECFLITNLYNEFFWQNKGVSHLISSAMVFYLFGIWTVSLMLFFSTIVSTNVGVLGGTGTVFGIAYLLGLFRKVKSYLPVKLLDATDLIYGHADLADYRWAIGITFGLILVAFSGAVVMFNRRSVSR